MSLGVCFFENGIFFFFVIWKEREIEERGRVLLEIFCDVGSAGGCGYFWSGIGKWVFVLRILYFGVR